MNHFDTRKLMIGGAACLVVIVLTAFAEFSGVTSHFLNPADISANARTQAAASAASIATTTPNCSQNNLKAATHQVFINEVAWAGIGKGKTSDEWLELKNTASATTSLAGWQLLNASESIHVRFDSHSAIAPQGFFLLERGARDTVAGVKADKLYSGALKNSDESLRLFDRDCLLIDEVVTGKNNTWLAGTASPHYRTAERSPDLSWHTYVGDGANGIFGTPRAENSAAPKHVVSTPTIAPPAPKKISIAPIASSTLQVPALLHILITAVMAGKKGNPEYEFIELYNPNQQPVDLTGFSIKKKSSSGTLATLVSASHLHGKIIPSEKHFLLANEGGYTGSVMPDVVWPSSYTFARANNAVILYAKNGEVSDMVEWHEIPEGKSYAHLSPNSNFVLADPNPHNSAD